MANERNYTVPLGKAYDYIRTKRVRRAVVLLRAFVARHCKVADNDVRVSNALNSLLWTRGIQKPPRKVKIKVVVEEGIAKAYMINEEIKKPEAKGEKEKEAEKAAEPKPTEKKTEAKGEGVKKDAVKKPEATKAPANVEKKALKAEKQKSETGDWRQKTGN